MRQWMMVRVVGMTLATIILVAGASTMAAEPAVPSAAPANPEFVQYMERAVAGAAVEMTEDGHPLGAVPTPMDLSHMSGQAAAMGPATPAGLPTSYDLRSISGKLPPVRDQASCGGCWSFATYGSMESCLLPAETWDFSEMDLICSSGFDYSQCSGGTHVMSTAYLARWDGPVTESCYPYASSPYICTSPRPSCTVQKHVQEVDFIPNGATTTIKNAVMNYGAVYTTMYWDPPYYNSATYSYYYNGSTTLNHAICIVGWDDNFSASNFNTTPPGNGAYIIRNSWGASLGPERLFLYLVLRYQNRE